MSLPYQHATSGRRAIAEIRKILQNFGVDQIAEAEDFRSHIVVISFSHNNVRVKVSGSADGWATAYLKSNPYSSRMRKSLEEYRQACLDQGKIAVCSMLRDWIKGQITAIETGLFSFETAFAGQILLPDGKTVGEKIKGDLQIEKSSNR